MTACSTIARSYVSNIKHDQVFLFFHMENALISILYGVEFSVSTFASTSLGMDCLAKALTATWLSQP